MVQHAADIVIQAFDISHKVYLQSSLYLTKEDEHLFRNVRWACNSENWANRALVSPTKRLFWKPQQFKREEVINSFPSASSILDYIDDNNPLQEKNRVIPKGHSIKSERTMHFHPS